MVPFYETPCMAVRYLVNIPLLPIRRLNDGIGIVSNRRSWFRSGREFLFRSSWWQLSQGHSSKSVQAVPSKNRACACNSCTRLLFRCTVVNSESTLFTVGGVFRWRSAPTKHDQSTVGGRSVGFAWPPSACLPAAATNISLSLQGQVLLDDAARCGRWTRGVSLWAV